MTRRDDVVDHLFGLAIPDPYRWLEDANDPEVQAWMAAQHATTRAALDALPGRAALVARFRSLFYFDAIGAPVRRGARAFWARKRADREKTAVHVRDGDGDERVLLDPESWSDDGSIALGGWWPSWDGATVAYNKNVNNADAAELHLLDVATSAPCGEIVPGTGYTHVSWAPDSRSFYYVHTPPVGGDVAPADQIGLLTLRHHVLGTDPALDPILREPSGDSAVFLGASLSRDGRWLFAGLYRGDNHADLYVRDLREASPAWTPLVVGQEATFTVEAWQDQFYVWTNLDAPRYRVMKVDPARRALDAWREIVPEDPEATLVGGGIVGGALALTYLRRATSELELRDLDGGHPRPLALPGRGSSGGLSGEPDDDTAYLAYTSFTEPQIIFEVSVATGQMREWTRVILPIDTTPHVTEQVTYPSKDGTPVTMFVIHHRDVTPTGERPTILYGYGGFNISMTPAFSAARLLWLERGGVYAIPNLRGGGEYGEDWHQGGMRAHKQHGFDDFLAAARWLVDTGWTRADRLAIHGGSNGGLLVGAAMTQAPEQFTAVVCAVPLLDMIRYPKVGIGTSWVPEYGSPEIEEELRWLLAYSPYHHVHAGTRYPALLMLSADSDDRVDPMHARKFVAEVQHASPDTTALLRIEPHGGHAGNDQVKQQVELAADIYAFLFDRLGVAE